jgi:predicted ATPase
MDSTINMGRVTLLIGNNNSGKSNLLVAIQHLSKLVARSRPPADEVSGGEIGEGRAVLREVDFFPHRHRLHADKPMRFEVIWGHRDAQATYFLELYEAPSARHRVGCKEQLSLQLKDKNEEKVISSGLEEMTDELLLNRKIVDSTFSPAIKSAAHSFFRDMAQAFGYHFQPNYLRGTVKREGDKSRPERLSIPPQLGYEGGNLQDLIVEVREKDERTFEKFIAELRRFNPSFHGVRRPRGLRGNERIVWEFDLGGGPPSRLDEFPPDVVSDGILKAAAVTLLTSTRYPPALILIEEIENGINPANIRNFISWLFQSASPIRDNERDFATQFIITSHSPTVLREFADKLENVYVVRLRQKGFVSDVRNLAVALDVLVGIGTVSGEIVEEEGKKVVKMAPYELAELWNNGTIG